MGNFVDDILDSLANNPGSIMHLSANKRASELRCGRFPELEEREGYVDRAITILTDYSHNN